MRHLTRKWLAMSIYNKLTTFVGALMVALMLAVIVNIYAMNYSTRQMGGILNSTAACERVQRAMRDEETAFRSYTRSRTDENESALVNAIAGTRRTLSELPYSYGEIGPDRYARTRNLRNAYGTYETLRDELLAAYADGSKTVEELYDLYEIQEMIEGYITSLLEITVEEGDVVYNEQYPLLQSFPFYLIMLSAVLYFVMGLLARGFASSMIYPITRLADAAGSVMHGDYETPDVVVDNEDELGDLVDAFNRMKTAVESNIRTLEENQTLQERLHTEELERVNVEHELETIRLDLLQSQINPHFLFNTLNTIAGMAEIEDAETSARMIRALSSIFRYNLHTTSQLLSLAQELAVIRDYLYLQQMRFGSRLTYEITANELHTDEIMVPAFMLQPLVENAISHGIARKETGGRITIDIRKEDSDLHIRVSDTGVGMTAAQLQELQRELEAGIHSHEDGKNLVGIGLGNIYQRIHRVYAGGEMRITAREQEGTTVELVLPQDEQLRQTGDLLI